MRDRLIEAAQAKGDDIAQAKGGDAAPPMRFNASECGTGQEIWAYGTDVNIRAADFGPTWQR